MKTMRIKAYAMLVVGLCAGSVAFAQVPGVVVVSTNYTVNPVDGAIPDANANGIQIQRNFSFVSPIIASNIADLNVTLNIQGDFNGDLYAYITHGNSGFSVLLNRVGRTAANPDGYGDDGFNIKLDDQAGATRDVHTYQVT